MKYPCPSACSNSSLLVGSPALLKPNPDIAGIGVLIGLILPALVVFVLIVIYYFVAVEAGNKKMCTTLDKSFLTWVRSRKNAKQDMGIEAASHQAALTQRKKWRQLLETVILGFSDAQLVNAFSLLFSEFTLGCKIDAYHWQILVQCIWFASATHLATIPILKAKLDEAETGHWHYTRLHQQPNSFRSPTATHKVKKSKLLIYLRAILMTIILAMLIASLIPTGHPLWLWGSETNPGTVARPALCFFNYQFLHEDKGNSNSVTLSAFGVIWLCWSIGLVAITYIKRLCELLRPTAQEEQREGSESWWMKVWRIIFALEQDMRETLKSWNTSIIKVMGRFFISNFLWHGLQETVRTSWRLLESFAWHIFWLFMMMAWNLYLLVYNKWFFHVYINGDDGGDEGWSFGQITPCVLLILPAITIVEAVLEPPKNEGPPTGKAPIPSPSQRTTNTKPHNFESTRITGFLMFEFALIFGILAYINFLTIPITAAEALGPGLIAVFVACLVLAPLLFAYMTLLSDEVTAILRLDSSSSRDTLHQKPQTGNDQPKNIWLRSIIAVIIGLGIGTSMVLVALAAFSERVLH